VIDESARLDRSSPVPLYQQLAEQLHGAIETGALSVGGRLGNEIRLAERFGVSRATMRRAIEQLVGAGAVVRKRGVGTSVVDGWISRPIRLTSLFDDLASEGQKPDTTVLVNEVIPASTEVASILNIAVGQPVLHLRRLRGVNGDPLAVLNNYVATHLIDLRDTDFSRIGLYPALRAVGVRPSMARQRIGAREGTPEECTLLDEPAGGALLTMDRITHSDTGRPVEWGRHIYRPDRYAFTVTLTAG